MAARVQTPPLHREQNPLPRPKHSPPERAAADHPDEDDRPYLWLRRKDQLVVAVLIAATLVLMFWHWARLSGWGVQPVEIDRQPDRWYEYKIDVNKATWVEWLQLDGIGETLAQRIVDDREKNGPFRSVDDLQRVKGIGPKTVEALRPWLTAGPAVEHPSTDEMPIKP